jgi:hypothetical protein
MGQRYVSDPDLRARDTRDYALDVASDLIEGNVRVNVYCDRPDHFDGPTHARHQDGELDEFEFDLAPQAAREFGEAILRQADAVAGESAIAPMDRLIDAVSGGRRFDELSASGLLWLINRAVFHPRGFALGLVHGADGKVTGWTLLGDGKEPWHYEDSGSEDRRFAAAEATLKAVRDRAD